MTEIITRQDPPGGWKRWLLARFRHPARASRRRTQWSDRVIRRVQVGVAAAVILAVSLMFPGASSMDTFNLREGDVYIGEQIIAPFTFAINKSAQEYAQDVEAAKRRVPPVFVRHAGITQQLLTRLDSFLDQLHAAWSKTLPRAEKVDSLAALCKRFGVAVPIEDLSFFTDRKPPVRRPKAAARANGERGTGRLFVVVREAATELLSVGILDTEKDRLPPGAEKISVVSDGMETIEPLAYYRGPKEAQNFALERIRQAFGTDAQMSKVAFQLLVGFLQPNLLIDQQETQARVAAEVASVPRAKGMVLEGERIIDSHEKVTAHHVEVLSSLAEARAQQGPQTLATLALRFVGRMLLVALSLALMGIFLYWEGQSVLYDPRRLLLLGLVILLVVAIAYGVNRLSLSSNLIPIAVASMLLAIFFDPQSAFVSTVALGLILGGMRGNDFGVIATSVLVGSAAILSVTKVRKRTWVVRSMLITSLAYLVSISVLGVLRGLPFSTLAKEGAYGLTNGIVSPIIAYGLVVVLELAFEITTDMTYLELSDLNNPLLRELALNAPGTYHHSIMVGNLAEAGAEVIGANGLLVRVGAYYHDIGKMEKPDYFVENQRGGRNPQDRLSPTMSALLLVNHVRRGSEMAKEHGLPAEIRDCIEQHHGTSVMSYFYQKAKELNGGNAVREEEFRYPGPKPQTKETALLMLADAVEAASRALRDPSVSRLRALVSEIIDGRFREGELDESPLTLRDLNKVGEAFLKILIGRYHRRVEYPKGEGVGSPLRQGGKR